MTKETVRLVKITFSYNRLNFLQAELERYRKEALRLAFEREAKSNASKMFLEKARDIDMELDRSQQQPERLERLVSILYYQFDALIAVYQKAKADGWNGDIYFTYSDPEISHYWEIVHFLETVVGALQASGANATFDVPEALVDGYALMNIGYRASQNLERA